MDKPKPPKPHPLGYPYMPTDIFAYGEAMAAWGAAQERERMQARIDALMLEHCPDEMSDEQKRNWAVNQVPSAQQRD